jgi:hypothetical protein
VRIPTVSSANRGDRGAATRGPLSLTVAAALLAAALAAGGCRDGGGSDAAGPAPAEPALAEPAPVESAPASAGVPETIPQPVLDDPRVAPESERVDLVSPTFSDPTEVTNPLFPISKQESVLLLGQVDGEPFRTEVTLLPDTRVIEWQGQQVETLVSQYVAFIDGRIHEVAYDYYAQDDNGSVWYFGEDVFNFKDGAISDTHGTWIAGKDGPAAMIMPADPKPGDAYRPENIPGLVFEEVTVKAVGQTLEGPLGPVGGGLVIEELHLLDNSTERKTFGPGYGEFLTGGGGDVEALALAVPTDALPEPTPAELAALEHGAADVFDAAGAGDWSSAQGTVAELIAAWSVVKTGEVPNTLEPELGSALDALAATVEDRDAPEARQAAIDVARWSLDLQLRHRPVTEVDLARFDLWVAQLVLDAEAGDAAAVNGDFFTLDYIRDRIQHTLDDADLTRLNTELEELMAAVGDDDLGAVATIASHLRETLSGFAPAS